MTQDLSTHRLRLHWLTPVALATVALLGCGGSDEAAPIQAINPIGQLATPCLQTAATGSVTVGSGLPGDPAIPEPSSG